MVIPTMSGPQEQNARRDRRQNSRGRRDGDAVLDAQIEELRRSFDRLERTVLPIAGQVAGVDGAAQSLERAVASLERWIVDERQARRTHDVELDRGLEKLEDHVDAEVRSLRELISTRFDACMDAIGRLGLDTRNGRRTLLVAIITTAGVIAAAVLTKGGI
jgi:hypothetical protein